MINFHSKKIVEHIISDILNSEIILTGNIRVKLLQEKNCSLVSYKKYDILGFLTLKYYNILGLQSQFIIFAI